MIDTARRFDAVLEVKRHSELIAKAKQLEVEERLGYKLNDGSIKDPIADREKKSLEVYSTSITDKLEEN